MSERYRFVFDGRSMRYEESIDGPRAALPDPITPRSLVYEPGRSIRDAVATHTVLEPRPFAITYTAEVVRDGWARRPRKPWKRREDDSPAAAFFDLMVTNEEHQREPLPAWLRNDVGFNMKFRLTLAIDYYCRDANDQKAFCAVGRLVHSALMPTRITANGRSLVREPVFDLAVAEKLFHGERCDVIAEAVERWNDRAQGIVRPVIDPEQARKRLLAHYFGPDGEPTEEAKAMLAAVEGAAPK